MKAVYSESQVQPRNFPLRLGICYPLPKDQRRQESSGMGLALQGGPWGRHLRVGTSRQGPGDFGAGTGPDIFTQGKCVLSCLPLHRAV